MQQYEKQGKNCISNDENGFSVVEVLVAVFVLAIIFTPILRSFLMAAQTNSRAQEIQNATAIAESLMEEAKGKTINGIINTPGCTVTAYNAADEVITLGADAAKYVILYDDINRTQGKEYAARVTLSTKTADVAAFNDIDFPQLKDIDSSENIVLSHEINRYDGSALETFLDRNVKFDPKQPWDDTPTAQWDRYTFRGGEDTIVGNFQKRVDLKIENDPDDSSFVKAECDVIFEKSVDASEGTKNFSPLNYSVYSYSIKKDSAPDTNNNNIYFFYTLMCDSAEIRTRIADSGSAYNFHAGREELNIDIPDTVLPGRDVYIVIQKDFSNEDGYKLVLAGTNTVQVNYKDSLGKETTLDIKNVFRDANGLSIRGHKLFINMEGDSSNPDITGNLYVTKKIDTAYDITVDVYEKGNITEEGKIATINSSMKKKQ